MKILVLCLEGNNRSVTIASQLKYWDHDVLTAGLRTNTPATLAMLAMWAERIIVTERLHQTFLEESGLPEDIMERVQLWDVGPDTYPRPYNKELLRKVQALMEVHREEYKQP